jgi:hypothetical protein
VTNQKPAFALALAAACALSGCATIVSGPRQTVKIDSIPQGATVTTAVQYGRGKKLALIKKHEEGVTPINVVITRKDGAVLLEKEGYKPVRVPLKRGSNPWVLGDVLMTSLISTSIDTSTGAAMEYDPDEYVVELVPDDEAAVVPAPAEAPPAPSVPQP